MSDLSWLKDKYAQKLIREHLAPEQIIELDKHMDLRKPEMIYEITSKLFDILEIQSKLLANLSHRKGLDYVI